LANILRKLEAQLPQALLPLLQEIGEAGRLRGENIYLVGGVVRDLLLGRPSLDLDLVIEGKAISLARRLAENKGWEIRTHPRFGTATLRWGDFSFDLAMARSETYAQPGALPMVKPSTIRDDLFRRDFTINAIAAHLSPESFGELLDPYQGKEDLDKGLIRILHRRSFSDDPTRILRALRYEQRLGFRLEPITEELLRRDAVTMDAVTGERLWHELELILEEKRPEKVLSRADELGLLRKFQPSIRGDGWLAEKLIQTRETSDESMSRAAIYLAVLTYRLTEEEGKDCIARLKVPGWAARTMRDTQRLKQILSSLAVPDLQRSEIYRRLEHYPAEVIEALALCSEYPIVQQRLELYLRSLRHVRLSLSGDDLQRMGVEPGKLLGQILRALHEAKLDQRVGNEEEFVRRLLAKKK